jgi:cyclohexanecarboxyl-CoA dehydrogenase
MGRRAPLDPDTGAFSVGVPVPSTIVRVVDMETGVRGLEVVFRITSVHMNFAFTDEQQQFATELARFAEKRLAPEYSRWDRGEPFPRERLKELAALGITGLRVPEEYGGQLASYVTLGVAAEELSRGDFNYSLFVQLTAITGDLVTLHGSEAVKQRWLPALASGDALLAFGLTEPGVGSDAARLSTRAVRKGNRWALSGEKASITFAGYADACVVFARTGGEGARGVSAFLVPLDQPGISRSVYPSPGEKLSQRGSLFLDEVEVDDDHMLGTEGGGFVQAMNSFDYNRAIIALAFVGAARQSLEETIAYTKERHAFGRPLATHEAVAFQVAEHLTTLEAARLLAYQALWKRDQGEPHAAEAAMAKLFAGRAGVDAVHASLLLHGHFGYTADAPFEQRLRDLIGLEIGDGTPEIMKGIIAREAYGRAFTAYR